MSPIRVPGFKSGLGFQFKFPATMHLEAAGDNPGSLPLMWHIWFELLAASFGSGSVIGDSWGLDWLVKDHSVFCLFLCPCFSNK